MASVFLLVCLWVRTTLLIIFVVTSIEILS
jgi:hypothetical protein